MGGAILVANASAQSGRAAGTIARARRELDMAGIDHSFVSTLPDGGTVAEVTRAVDEGGARLVVYLGGDGTFAEVAKGILAAQARADVSLGMLPMGTANDQGKSFGLRAGADAFAANVGVIVDNYAVKLDVGRVQCLNDAEHVVHRDLFFDSMSFGFCAAVLARRNRNRGVVNRIPVVRSLYRDQLMYAGAMLGQIASAAWKRPHFAVEAVIDDQVHRFDSLFDVIVKNTKIYGGEWVLNPEAEHDDGLFELVPMQGHRDLTMKLVSTLRHNSLTQDDLRAIGLKSLPPIPGSRLTLTVINPGAPEPPPAQIDGEEMPASDRYQISVWPRSLRILVPRPS